MVVVEFGFLAVNDSIFFLSILWALIVVWFKRDRFLSTQFALVFLSTFFLAALNGPMGDGFRYQIPIVMFSLLVLKKCDPSQKSGRK